MLLSECSIERTFLYEQGDIKTNERYHTINCIKNECNYEINSTMLKAFEFDELSCKMTSLQPSDTEMLISLFNRFNKSSDYNNVNFSFFITNKATKRWSTKYTNCLSESTLRIICHKQYGVQTVYDLPLNFNILATEMLMNEIVEQIANVKDHVKSNSYKKASHPTQLIFAPKAAAFLFHEVVGHMLELDNMQSEHSVYSGFNINDQLFNHPITISDDPAAIKKLGIDFGEYDDMGKYIKKTTIIDNGYINSFIDYQRCDSVRNTLQSRMYCLCVERNENGLSLDEITKNARDSILIHDIHSGWIDTTTGNFTLMCGFTQFIRCGVPQEHLSNFIINDDVFSISNNIVHVGSDIECFIGKCTKNGQVLTVGQSAPTIVVKHKNLVI